MNLRPARAVRAAGETMMHRHGPSDYTGPLRGTTAWWHGRQEASAGQPEPTPSPVPDTSPGVRHDLVERVRREIAAGDYDTPEKWHAALDRLLDRLERE
jgi:hypothetical protein